MKNKLNSDFIIPTLNKSKTSIISKLSENQSSNSKLALKDNNYSDINSIKSKNVVKNTFSKFKTDQISNYRKNKTKISGNIYKRTKRKSNFSYNRQSFQTEKLFSMKTLEKNIQQKIIDISLRIEKESSLLREETHKINASLFIKKKLGRDSEIEQSSFISKQNLTLSKKDKNQSISGKKKFSYDFSPKIGDKDWREFHSFLFFSKYKKKKRKKDKFRNLFKKKILYDSFDSEEEEEIENFFISPYNKVILIIDLLVILSTIFNMIFTPYFLSNTKCFCSPKIKYIDFIYIIIDILYIIDLIFGFFRAYHNFQFQLITNNKRIMRHYLITQFFFDLIQAIPFFSYKFFLCRESNNYINCTKFNMKNTHIILILCCLFKQLKIFKIINIKKNIIYYKITIIVSHNDLTEKLLNIFVCAIICFVGFYLFISIHIFIGNNTYPNWIIKTNSQNDKLIILYVTSLYYLITTLTTVGYGDIVCGSFGEIIFQIFLLSAGVIIYSFIISTIGNYVKNESHASMKFEKDEAILEEIRISYPNMPFKLYNQIFHHLSSRKIRQQQCDSNILINSLPYSLKNDVLLTIHKQTIKNFKIFKGHQNTDFTLRLLTNFIPVYSRKNAFLIHEGELIENIIFVKEGRLSLEASIDIVEPGKSVMQYLSKNFIDINEDVVIVSSYDTSFRASKFTNMNYNNYVNRVKAELDTVINYKNKANNVSSINESNIGKELGKWDFGGEAFEENNYQFIHIINISKNESYGSVYMFLSKPSPLSLRVKSKKAELLLLRKSDVSKISYRYPKIWAKYFKKSYINMLSIKQIAIHKIKHYWINLGKELFKNCQIKKAKTDYANDMKNTPDNNQKDNIGIVINIKEYDNFNNNIDNKGTNMINNNKILKSNRISLDSYKSLKNVTFKNSDLTKYISFNKDTNIINRKSFQNIHNKKYRGSYSITSHKNIIDEKRFSKKSLKTYLGSNFIFKNRASFNKLASYYPQKVRTSVISKNQLSTQISKRDRLSSQISKRNIQNLRIEYLKKLKRKIKNLKKSKKYYKDLCKKIYLKEQPINEKEIFENDNCCENNILDSFDKKQLNKKKFHSFKVNEKSKNITEINISRSSKETTSFSTARSFNLDDISISSPIQLTYNSKYKNLNTYSLGEYSKNRNLRKSTQKFIQFYTSNFPKRKGEKNFETIFSSIQSFDTSNIENEFYPSCSPNNKSNLFRKKSTVSNPNSISERQYLIIYDFIKNTFDLIHEQNQITRNKFKKYTKKLSSNSPEKQNYNDNLKKPVRSLFSLNKNTKKDDTLKEWEHDINFDKKYSYDLEHKNKNNKNVDEKKRNTE